MKKKNKKILKIIGILSLVAIPVLFALYYFVNNQIKKLEYDIENKIYLYQDQPIGEGLYFGFDNVKCNYIQSDMKCFINKAFIYGKNDKYMHKLLNLHTIEANINEDKIIIQNISLDKDVKAQIEHLTRNPKDLNKLIQDIEPLSLTIKGLVALKSKPTKEKYLSLNISNKLLNLSANFNIYVNNINNQNINFLEHFKGELTLKPTILNEYFYVYKIAGNRLNNIKSIKELNFNFLGKKNKYKINKFQEFKNILKIYTDPNYKEISKVLSLLSQNKKVKIIFEMQPNKKISNKDKFAKDYTEAITKFRFQEFQKNNYKINLKIKGI